MNLKHKLKNWRFWIGILAVILLIPFILNMTLFQFTTSFTYKGGDWLSFWGSYSGGILSGIVAFVVARMTITADRQNQAFKKRLEQLPALVKIKIEVQKIIENIEKASEERNKITEKLEDEDKSNLELFRIDVELLDKERWSQLDNIIDINLQIKLIELMDFYDKWSKSLRYDGNNDIALYRQYNYNNGLIPLGTIETPVEQTEKYIELEYNINYHSANSIEGWEKINGGYKESIIKIRQEIEEEIEEINKEKERFENK
ncbi:hypothetical protein ACFTRE_10705 [Bacillus subtilis]|uniref:hypothetical protein n=1 Tax=Bacillus subtilis TaxID=1423 RepID=UPI0003499989|nr:hypothetical protein [Bacillus subtilis]KIN39924.1 hypothetical protein B4070_4335 [Bacillus subtilis]MCM3060607.1 hypothetical protein [Bacillus subtilis]